MSADEDASHQTVNAINEVRINYTDATPLAATYVATDLVSQALVGIRTLTVESLVRAPADATEIGDRLLRISQRLGRWRHPPATWDASPPAARVDVTETELDATARAVTMLASVLIGRAAPELPTVLVAGSIYNRLPIGSGGGATVPWWQILGGRVTYTGGRMAGSLNLAPRYFSALPNAPTWGSLDGTRDTLTWNDLAATHVDRSVAWADLPAFAAD